MYNVICNTMSYVSLNISYINNVNIYLLNQNASSKLMTSIGKVKGIPNTLLSLSLGISRKKKRKKRTHINMDFFFIYILFFLDSLFIRLLPNDINISLLNYKRAASVI